jgi:hypothetical protein
MRKVRIDGLCPENWQTCRQLQLSKGPFQAKLCGVFHPYYFTTSQAAYAVCPFIDLRKALAGASHTNALTISWQSFSPGLIPFCCKHFNSS